MKKLIAATALLGLGASGCEWVALGIALSDDDDCECCNDECWEEPPPPDPAVPPNVTITIADWPPVGATGQVAVTADAPNGLDFARFSFRNVVDHDFPFTTSGTVSATGAELGEGLGNLVVRVTGSDGAFSEKTVQNLLVDLSPPSAFFDKTVLPADSGSLNFWIGDAWVVSGYEISIDGNVIDSTILEEGYPETLGVEWDFSYVTIPAEYFPLGTSLADVLVFDAAGNAATIQIPLTIDGVPPEVGIPSPSEGDVLDGTFDVTVTATDDTALPATIEISIGGALVATGASPTTTITFSTSEFPAGPTEIRAVAVDEAGNRSPALIRNVVLGSGEE